MTVKRPGTDGESRFLSRWSTRKRAAGQAAASHVGEAGAEPGAEAVEDTEPSACDARLATSSREPAGSAIGTSAVRRPDCRDRIVRDGPVPEPVAPAYADHGSIRSDSAASDAAPTGTTIELPALESLDHTSDLSVFFAQDVPAALKRAALRRVFALPKYNVRDGLDDYDDDYTQFEPLGDTVTADMRYRSEVAARREREALAARTDEPVESEPPIQTLEPGEAATAEPPEPALVDESMPVSDDIESTGCSTRPGDRGATAAGVRTREGTPPANPPALSGDAERRAIEGSVDTEVSRDG